MSAPDDRDDDPFRPPADTSDGARGYGWGTPPPDPARPSWDAAQQGRSQSSQGSQSSQSSPSSQGSQGWGQPDSSPNPYGGPAPYGGGPSGPDGPASPPVGQPDAGWGAGYGQVAAPDHPRSTTAMVLGISALVGGMLCLLPILLSPAAWIVGRNAVKDIDASGGRLGGRGQAKAGVVMGIIGTVILALGILGVVAFIGLVASIGFA